MKTFMCGTCGTPVSRPVEAGAPVSTADGEPLVPAGRFAVVADEYGPEHVDFHAIHLGDALNTRLVPMNGCCGQDGLDGLNTRCANGHKIGIEKSDCWMPHALLLDPARVTAR